jgi:hypothetical protein
VKRNGRAAITGLSCCSPIGDVGLEGPETVSDTTDIVLDYEVQVTLELGEIKWERPAHSQL